MQPGLAASYLVRSGERAAFIETGTALGVPRLLETLERKGIDRAQVDYVIPTHVHLDHAGGAGTLMRALPNARLVAHPRGARHMIDPTRLWAGASQVYGEQAMRRNYGELVPVPADRVIEAADGFVLDLAGRQLLFLDTPGHARHHFCVFDERSAGFFTGDTFGMSLRTFDTARGPFIYLPSAPVQFDPEAWHRTLARLLAFSPHCMYLTHFGRVEEVQSLAAELDREIDAYTALARAMPVDVADPGEYLRAVLREHLLQRLREHGCELSEQAILGRIGMDVEINAQGLAVWLNSTQTPA